MENILYMAKVKFIIVEDKSIKKIVDRVSCEKFCGDFQIGYEAGKLVSKYPEDGYVIYMEEIKI